MGTRSLRPAEDGGRDVQLVASADEPANKRLSRCDGNGENDVAGSPHDTFPGSNEPRGSAVQGAGPFSQGPRAGDRPRAGHKEIAFAFIAGGTMVCSCPEMVWTPGH